MDTGWQEELTMAKEESASKDNPANLSRLLREGGSAGGDIRLSEVTQAGSIIRFSFDQRLRDNRVAGETGITPV